MEDTRIQLAIEHLKSILIEGETLIAVSPQHRLFTIFPFITGGGNNFLFKRRDIIAVTSGRFIYMKRNLFGGYQLNDIRWQDVDNAVFYRGIFAADFKIFKYTSTDLTINKMNSYFLNLIGYDIEKTQEVYKYVQKQEQEWREKRRIGTLPQGIASVSSVEKKSVSERLSELKKMYEEQLISDSEYENLKAKIISEL